MWLGGQTIGLDWNDVATLPGLAHGTDAGTGEGDKSYDDSTALLSGMWRSHQGIAATVHIANENDRDFQEVELRLRSTLASHSSRGYEILFRCLKGPTAYASIVRWNGRLGEFTYLVQKQGTQYGVSNGDVVKATIDDNVITAYVNGVALMSVTDDTYSSGSPGIGFWLSRGSGWRTWFQIRKADNSDCGFSSVVAWD